MTGLFLSVALPFLGATAVLLMMWNAQAFQSRRLVGQALVLWVPPFLGGFLVGGLFSLALFFVLSALFVFVRSFWQEDDGWDELWDFYPHNPLGGKRKSGKDYVIR